MNDDRPKIDVSISVEERRRILEKKIEFHKKEYYGYSVEARAAGDVGGLDRMVKAAVSGMTQTLKLVESFQKQLVKLPDVDQEVVDEHSV